MDCRPRRRLRAMQGPSDAGKQRTGAGMWPGGEGTQGRRAGEEHGRRAMEGEGLSRAVLDGRLSHPTRIFPTTLVVS